MMKPGKFRLTSYALGRAVETITVDVLFESDLHKAADRLHAHGLPGSHPRAAAKSRVIGVKRLA